MKGIRGMGWDFPQNRIYSTFLFLCRLLSVPLYQMHGESWVFRKTVDIEMTLK